MDDVLMTCQK